MRSYLNESSCRCAGFPRSTTPPAPSPEARKPTGWVGTTAALVGAAAHLAAMFLAWFAVYEFRHDRDVTQRQFALETVARAKDAAVLEALVRLDEHADNADYDYAERRVDIARVMNWYEYLAGLYLTDGLIDHCVVTRAVIPYVSVIQTFLERTEYPSERRANFDLLINRLTLNPCEPSVPADNEGAGP